MIFAQETARTNMEYSDTPLLPPERAQKISFQPTDLWTINPFTTNSKEAKIIKEKYGIISLFMRFKMPDGLKKMPLNIKNKGI